LIINYITKLKIIYFSLNNALYYINITILGLYFHIIKIKLYFHIFKIELYFIKNIKYNYYIIKNEH